MSGSTRFDSLRLGTRRPLVRHTGIQRLVSQGTGILPHGKSIGSLHQIPAGSIAVQFELANLSTSETTRYNAAYALSTGINDCFTPLNHSGVPDDSLWTPITSGGSTTLTVPTAASALQPGLLVSDVMPFVYAPPARADGGTGICLFYRQYCLSGLHTIGNFDGTVGEWNGYKNGQSVGQFSMTFGGSWVSNGNFCVSGKFAHHDLESRTNVYAPNAVIPTVMSPTLTVMSVGDSILSGVASRGNIDRGINSVGLQLVKMLDKPARPALHYNLALSGMANANYIAGASSAILTSVPDIILLQPYSPNDPDSTQPSVVWTEIQRSMTFAAQAASLGAAVVLLTNPPYSGVGSVRSADIWEASRTYANSIIKGSGLPTVDVDMVAGTGSNPVNYRVDLSDDSIHLNETGAKVLATAAAEVIAKSYGFV